jgi:hypothetical protein
MRAPFTGGLLASGTGGVGDTSATIDSGGAAYTRFVRTRSYLFTITLGMMALAAFVGFTGPLGQSGAKAARLQAGLAPVSRVFIGGVAADAGPSSPDTGPSAAVTAGHLGRSNANGLGQPTVLTVYGDLHNGLNHPIGAVSVTVTAAWSGGTDTRTATLPVQTVPAGADAPFTVLMGGGDDRAAALSVKVADYVDLLPAQAIGGIPVNLGAPVAPAIGPPDPKTGIVPLSDNLLGVSGTVVNTTAAPIRVDRVAVAIYEPDGTVALVGSTGGITAAHPGTDPAVLAPGEAGTFIIYLPRATLLSIPGATIMRGFVSAQPAP